MLPTNLSVMTYVLESQSSITCGHVGPHFTCGKKLVHIKENRRENSRNLMGHPSAVSSSRAAYAESWGKSF